MSLITKKINNNEYAPGIATYGAAGQNGEQGNDGNSIYYTSFNLISGEDLPTFKMAVHHQQLPVTSGAYISRPYKNGDYFFDKFGNIFELWNIEDLKNHPNLGNDYLRYFKKVGKIQSNNKADNIFSTIEESSRISLNPKFAGVDINSVETEYVDTSTETYPLRIISNNLNGDNIELLQATAFYNTDKMSDLKIYYDTVLNVWHINSDKPIVIDSELTINKTNNDNIDLDDYSPVIINDTPITVFYNYCRNILWGINGSNGILLFNFPEFPKDILKQLKIKILIQTGDTQETIFLSAVDSGWDETMCYTGTFKSIFIKQVSLIYNIEVFLDKLIVPRDLMQTPYNLHDKLALEKITNNNLFINVLNPNNKNKTLPEGVKRQKFTIIK